MPGSTLKRGGRERISLTRKDKPISVAMLQWATVGVKLTLQTKMLTLLSLLL